MDQIQDAVMMNDSKLATQLLWDAESQLLEARKYLRWALIGLFGLLPFCALGGLALGTACRDLREVRDQLAITESLHRSCGSMVDSLRNDLRADGDALISCNWELVDCRRDLAADLQERILERKMCCMHRAQFAPMCK